jgi:hypothetical protein
MKRQPMEMWVDVAGRRSSVRWNKLYIDAGAYEMKLPKEYRRFALECNKRAAASKDEPLRKPLTDQARHWLEISLEVERSWALMADDDPAKLRN